MKKSEQIPLAEYWNAPADDPNGRPFTPGAPIACIASTYTFDANFFEVDLLPRFLGLKFDNTEGDKIFLVERESRLGTIRPSIIVDQLFIDPKQTTLRWDQIPVRVPGGAQHSKIVILAWQRCVRLIVSSANLTKAGYRRNREIAGAIDFYNNENSPPLKPLRDAIDFLKDIAGTDWLRGHPETHKRLNGNLAMVKSLIAGWDAPPKDFTNRMMPRVTFVGGRPAINGRSRLSVMQQLSGIWGSRTANYASVLTPFVGDPGNSLKETIAALTRLCYKSEGSVETALLIPGHPNPDTTKDSWATDLPRYFKDSWDEVWGKAQKGPATFLIDQNKDDLITRALHAKAVWLSNGEHDALLCGSSNFTPHGMGVNFANIEANFCYLTESRKKVARCLPIEDDDEKYDVVWSKLEKQEDPDDEKTSFFPVPVSFKAITINQQAATITAYFEPGHKLPSKWEISHPSANTKDGISEPLFDSSKITTPPESGMVTINVPDTLKWLLITYVVVSWTDDEDTRKTGLLPVHIENAEHLLPPEELRGLTAESIMSAIISGREPEELIVGGPGRGRSGKDPAVDSLHDIDTSGYALYQVRRLGQALAGLGERLTKTVRTREAMSYRLFQDPLGPKSLANALAKQLSSLECSPGAQKQMRCSQLIFSYAEISLMLAHAYRRIKADIVRGEQDTKDLYKKAVDDILAMTPQGNTQEQNNSVLEYTGFVREECDRILS